MSPKPKTRTVLIDQQRIMLVDAMEKDRMLLAARCNAAEDRLLYKKKWMALAQKLNDVAGGPTKTVPDWQKTWVHIKNQIKKRGNAMRMYECGVSSDPPERPLTTLEERAFRLLEESMAGFAVSEVKFQPAKQELIHEPHGVFLPVDNSLDSDDYNPVSTRREASISSGAETSANTSAYTSLETQHAEESGLSSNKRSDSTVVGVTKRVKRQATMDHFVDFMEGQIALMEKQASVAEQQNELFEAAMKSWAPLLQRIVDATDVLSN